MHVRRVGSSVCSIGPTECLSIRQSAFLKMLLYNQSKTQWRLEKSKRTSVILWCEFMVILFLSSLSSSGLGAATLATSNIAGALNTTRVRLVSDVSLAAYHEAHALCMPAFNTSVVKMTRVLLWLVDQNISTRRL